MSQEENRAQPAAKERLPRGRRRAFIWLAVLSVPMLFYVVHWATFPSDKTPEGAYLRIVKAVNRGKPEAFFAYTEEPAQHACFTIRNYRKEILQIAEADFPKEQLEELKTQYDDYAQAPDGPDIFALMAREHGWLAQLRLDMSGIAKIERQGPRATIETAKGTRYSMRERPNGIWGLTAFTPLLVEEAEKAARDVEQIKKAAADFQRVRSQGN